MFQNSYTHTTQGRQRALWCPYRKTCIINAHKTASKLHTETHSATAAASGHAGACIWAVYVVTLHYQRVMLPSMVPRRLHPAPLHPHKLISFSAQIKEITWSKDRAKDEHRTGGEEGQFPISSHGNRNLFRILFHPLQYLQQAFILFAFKTKGTCVCEGMGCRLPHLRLDWSLHISLIMALTIAFG